MIGRLHGILIEKQPPYLLLDVQGVGYEVQAPMTTFYRLPAVGKEVTLHTHLSISENFHQLFGFFEIRDRSLFRTLIKVNGVGPKMAITILSGMEADDIARCVREDNTAALTKLPGIGKKTAERLVIELRDRLTTWDLPQGSDIKPNTAQPFSSGNEIFAEAESALIALGYKPVDAAKMIAAAAKQNKEGTSQELIRLALRSIASA